MAGGASIKGSILLGAFLYCIKNSAFRQEGILELAGGYSNIQGFISYTKMGFNKDLSLYDPVKHVCFWDIKNLPMSCDISTINNETIINRAGERERRVVTPIEDDSGIYSAGKIDPSIQYRLILCNDLLYRIQLNYANILNNYTLLGYRDIINKFDSLVRLGANTEDRMVQQLINEREQILQELVPKKKNCLRKCIDGVCSYICGGKRKTKKIHKKCCNKKCYNKKSCNKKLCNKKSYNKKSYKKRRQ
jgi:hypothetical protein